MYTFKSQKFWWSEITHVEILDFVGKLQYPKSFLMIFGIFRS